MLAEIRAYYTSLGVDGSVIQHMIIWSDNCAGQFKSKATLGWAIRFCALFGLISVVCSLLFIAPFFADLRSVHMPLSFVIPSFRFLTCSPQNMAKESVMETAQSSKIESVTSSSKVD